MKSSLKLSKVGVIHFVSFIYLDYTSCESSCHDLKRALFFSFSTSARKSLTSPNKARARLLLWTAKLIGPNQYIYGFGDIALVPYWTREDEKSLVSMAEEGREIEGKKDSFNLCTSSGNISDSVARAREKAF